VGDSIEVLTDVVAESLIAEGGSLTTHGDYVDSLTSTERGLVSVLADVMHVDRVPLDSHFSDDLGADSLAMVHFCARGRKRADLPALAITDGYRDQTLRTFEIPRSMLRDTRTAHLERGRRRGIAAKDRYDIAGVGLFLVARWFLFGVISLVLLATADLYGSLGAAVIAGAGVLILLFGIFYLVLVERAVSHFRRLRPQYCSIYSRVFDDGCAIIEKTPTTVGDGCTLNAGSRMQSHSQEDGSVKSDHITIGAGCTLGVGSLVHSGVTMGDGAVLAPDSFLMEGEDVPPYARWGGNPAREIDDNRAAVQVGGK
jgi:hypothetical protein